MTTLNFPNGPSSGDTYTFNGTTFEFDGVAWNSNGTASGGSGGTAGVTQIIAGTGISVNNSGVGNVTVSASVGDARCIDDRAIALNQDPDNENLDWSTILQYAADEGGSWIFPDRTYKFSSTIDFNGRNSVWSAKTLGQRPEFSWTGGVPSQPTNNGAQAVIPCCMFCDGNIRFYGIRFSVANGSRHHINNAAYLLFQSTASGFENDTDSSVDWCNFSNIQSTRDNSFAARIVYLGRNFRCTNNVFSSGKPNNGDYSGSQYDGSSHIRCISLSYGLNPNGDTSGSDNAGDGQNLESGGYRRTIIRDNTFHLRKNAEAIKCFKVSGSGAGFHYGLNVTGNSIDVGGSLLVVEDDHKLYGAIISGNSCFRSDEAPYIYVDGGEIVNSAFTGNSFVCGFTEANANETDDTTSDGIKVESDSVFDRNTISGNSFSRPQQACINLLATCNKISITGNSFTDDNANTSRAIRVTSGSGVITSNVSDCSTFLGGSNTNAWIKSNNIES